MYMAVYGRVIRRDLCVWVRSPSYADDTQVYISALASDHSDVMRRLSDCVTLIRDWMANNRLKLNEDKTQVIWLQGTRQQLSNHGTIADFAECLSTVHKQC